MCSRVKEEINFEQRDFVGQTLDADLVANFLEQALDATDTPEFVQGIRLKIREFNDEHETNLSLRQLLSLYRGDTQLFDAPASSDQLATLTQWLEKQIFFELKLQQEDQDITVEPPNVRTVYQAVKEFNQRAVGVLKNQEDIQAAIEAERAETYQGILIRIAELPEHFTDDDIKIITKDIRNLPEDERRNFLRFLVGKTEGQLDPKTDVPLIEARTGMDRTQLSKIWNPQAPSKKPTHQEIKNLILGLTVFERAPAELIRSIISEDGVASDDLIKEFNDLTTEQRRAFQLIFQYQMNGVELSDDYVNSGLTKAGATFILETVDTKVRRAQAREQALSEAALMAELEDEADEVLAAKRHAEKAAKKAENEDKKQKEIAEYSSVNGVIRLLNSSDEARINIIKEIITNRLKPNQVQIIVNKIKHTFGLQKAPKLVTLVQDKNKITLKGNQKNGIEAFLGTSPENLKPAYWELIIKAVLRSARQIQ